MPVQNIDMWMCDSPGCAKYTFVNIKVTPDGWNHDGDDYAKEGDTVYCPECSKQQIKEN